MQKDRTGYDDNYIEKKEDGDNDVMEDDTNLRRRRIRPLQQHIEKL